MAISLGLLAGSGPSMDDCYEETMPVLRIVTFVVGKLHESDISYLRNPFQAQETLFNNLFQRIERLSS